MINTQGYRIEIPTEENPVIIKVIGVGGMGGNAVKHMCKMKMQDVNFAVCNTDSQALKGIDKDNTIGDKLQKLQLGDGLGAGTEAKAGEEAARASLDEIRNLLAPPTKMVFITAGMGGGTGTGAAPVVAEIAREMGLLTVAVVTAPYWYEGTDKKDQAREGIEKLKDSCDTVLVVLNDKLAELYSDLTWTEAYAHADDVLANAVKSIAEIITTQGDINADFADVKKVLQKAGQSVMGSAEASGEDRALKAIEAALNSPLLNDHDILGAERILLTISSSKKYAMKLGEQTAISEHVANKIGDEARMFKFGAITDDNLGENLRVTIIAAGFDASTLEGIDKSKQIATGTGILTGESEEPQTGTSLLDDETDDNETPVNLVLVDTEEDEPEPEPAVVSTNTGGYNGSSSIVTPEPPTVFTGSNDDDKDILEMGNDKRPDDSELIQSIIDKFVKGQYLAADLDRPTFERNRTVLYSMPLLAEEDFARSNLND